MGQDPSEIRREIEQTRARMGDTVEALSYKTDVPARARDAVQDRVETVKETVAGASDAATSTTKRLGSALGGARDAAGALGESLRGTAGNVAGAVRDRAGSVAGAVRDKVPDPSDVARRAGIAAENPVGLLLGALALGFLIGLVAPVTEIERERVGPVRDDLLEKAGNLGAGALEHGRQVLAETAQTAVQTAQQVGIAHAQRVLSEGDAPGGVAGAVIEHGRQAIAETAQAVIQTAQQSVQEHGAAVLREVNGDQQRDGEGQAMMPAGAQIADNTGLASSRYEGLLQSGTRSPGGDAGTNSLEPGAPGTASP